MQKLRYFDIYLTTHPQGMLPEWMEAWQYFYHYHQPSVHEGKMGTKVDLSNTVKTVHTNPSWILCQHHLSLGSLMVRASHQSSQGWGLGSCLGLRNHFSMVRAWSTSNKHQLTSLLYFNQFTGCCTVISYCLCWSNKFCIQQPWAI